MPRIRIVLAIVFVLLARGAHAQSGRGYVGGGFMISTWGPRESPSSSPSLSFAAGTGGTVPGFSVEAGFSLNARLSVAGELGFPARHESTQVSAYVLGPFQQKNRYRDVTIGAVGRVRSAATGAVRPAFVGGVELVEQSALQRRADGRFSANGTVVYEPFGDERKLKGWTAGAVIGGDLMVTASKHLEVVPQVRLHFIARDDVTQPLGTLGLPTRMLRAGVGVRATF